MRQRKVRTTDGKVVIEWIPESKKDREYLERVSVMEPGWEIPMVTGGELEKAPEGV